MAETDQIADAAVAVSPVTTPKKAKKTAAKKPMHPKTSDMVNNAIKDLKERGGSSLQAVKKYIAANYKVDAEKLAPFIRKYLKAAVTSGALVQTKGKGASGSFKLAVTSSKDSSSVASKKPKAKRTASSSTVAKKPVKKSPTAKTTAAKQKPATPKKKSAAAVVKVKKPVAVAAKKAVTKKPKAKSVKVVKTPTKKSKSPKPKKVAAKSTKKSPRKK